MFTKPNVSPAEYTICKYVHGLGIVNTPEPISYDSVTKTMTMVSIPQLDISNMYGEGSNDPPEYVFDEIRQIIKKLYDHGIVYPDITGYNFIEWDGKIWIIDFEHCEINPSVKNPFVLEFIDGANTWNPLFR